MSGTSCRGRKGINALREDGEKRGGISAPFLLLTFAETFAFLASFALNRFLIRLEAELLTADGGLVHQSPFCHGKDRDTLLVVGGG